MYVFDGYMGEIVGANAFDGAFLGAERGTNGCAELQANCFASLWMLRSGLKNFRYCYDAVYAEKMSAALFCPKKTTR